MKLCICTAIAALVLIAAACSERAPNAVGAATPTAITLPDDGPTGEYVGVITSSEASVVALAQGGRIERIEVRAGDRVEAGDVLVVLDDRAARQNAASARAEIEIARASRRAAAVELADARAKLGLERRLYRRGVSARESVRSAEVAVAMAQSHLSRTSAELDAAEARAGELDRVLTETTVRAPRAGLVSHLRIQPGEQLPAGTAITRIIDPGNLRIRFAVPGEMAGQFSIGQAVSLVADDNGQVVAGAIVSLAPELDPPLRLVIIDAEITGASEGSASAGLIGRVRLLANES